MQKPCLLVYINDLYFQSVIEEIVLAQNMDVYFAAQGEQLSQLAKTLAPFMMIVDLSGIDSEWLFGHIGSIRPMRPEFPMVALVSQEQDEVRDRAEKYGVNRVLTKAEFVKKLPDVIEHFLLGSH